MVQMPADFLPPFKETSKHFLLYLLRIAHPSLLNRLPAQIASIPLEQIWVSAEDVRGLKYLFNLISYPLSTDMGIEVEVLQYYFIQGSFNIFILSPRLLQSPEALKARAGLSPSFPFTADEATARS